MKRAIVWFLCVAGPAVVAAGQGTASPYHVPTTITYTLVEGSFFIDDCFICGRPTILQPLRGTFDLIPKVNIPPYRSYEIRNIDFRTVYGWAVEITGQGSYQVLEEFAVVQNMDLTTEVRDAFTNRVAYFESGASVVEQPFPAIEISLAQTNGTVLHTFFLDLVAVPLREVWFSTAKPLQAETGSEPANWIGPGDLISNCGRVVRRNFDLVSRLGLMPIAPDLGLDAVTVARRGEILFSILSDAYSETLGHLGHGDLLSDAGRIVKRNAELLSAFCASPPVADAGLDAVQRMPDGEILFSIRDNVVVGAGLTLSHGDVLSDEGRIVRTNRELLSLFQPSDPDHDYGLDALYVLPGGEIWFSVEEGFSDARLGLVRPGDLLSSRGRRVFTNPVLLAGFLPTDPLQDYGLDALYVVADTRPPQPPPRVLAILPNGAAGTIRIEWDGEGEVFQIHRADGASGPWLPCSPILPDLEFDHACDPSNGHGFYRLQQW